jgi:hypothetical protein
LQQETLLPACPLGRLWKIFRHGFKIKIGG